MKAGKNGHKQFHDGNSGGHERRKMEPIDTVLNNTRTEKGCGSGWASGKGFNFDVRGEI